MTNLYILAIDSDDDYSATLHTSREAAEKSLRSYAEGFEGPDPETPNIDDLIGALQDDGVEVNITEVESPLFSDIIERHRLLAEEAGTRMTRAINSVIVDLENAGNLAGIAELKGAAADAYDTGVDLPMILQGRYAAEHTLDDVWSDVQKLLERGHNHIETTYVQNITQPVTGVDDIQAAALEDALADDQTTRYGVRVSYADDTAFDYDNVTGVQVYDKSTQTFPFGFLELEVDTPNPDGSHELTREYRAGWWRPEDGEFVPFSAAEAPKPNNGW